MHSDTVAIGKGTNDIFIQDISYIKENMITKDDLKEFENQLITKIRKLVEPLIVDFTSSPQPSTSTISKAPNRNIKNTPKTLLRKHTPKIPKTQKTLKTPETEDSLFDSNTWLLSHQRHKDIQEQPTEQSISSPSFNLTQTT